MGQLIKMATRSVFTNDCLFMERDNDIDDKLCKCTICSARFSPIPNHHAPGNIWIAHCSYIIQLISPDHFDNAMQFFLQSIISNSKEGRWKQEKEKFIRTKSNSIYLGTSEYALSHWAFSHPNVCPCDIY